MNKKTDLAKGLARSAEETRIEAPEQPTSDSQKTTAKRNREVSIPGWYPMEVRLALDEIIAIRRKRDRRRVTQQEILNEALNDLFKKYGMPEYAPSK